MSCVVAFSSFCEQNKGKLEPGTPDHSPISATPRKSILDIKTYCKPTEHFQYLHFTSCHPPGFKTDFIQGKEVRSLRTKSSNTTFEEYLTKLKLRVRAPIQPPSPIGGQTKGKKITGELTFVTTYHPAVQNLKQLVKDNWSTIQISTIAKNYL